MIAINRGYTMVVRTTLTILLTLIGAAGCGQQQSVSSGANTADTEAQIYRWKLITTWPKNLPGLGTAPEKLANKLRIMSNGRLDIKVYSAGHFPFAVMYFTGSDYFNRSMRLYCQKKGLSLSDKELRPVVRVKNEKVHEGAAIPCATERDIFVATGLPYKAPEERDL